jgi:transposase
MLQFMKQSRMTQANLLRRKAVAQVIEEGHPVSDVADLLGVTTRSVRRWLSAFKSDGELGLESRPHTGRTCKLTARQEAEVLSWLEQNPVDWGFATQRWTARRIAELIDRHFSVRMNHRYLNAWLAARGITPQIPARVPRERDESLIARWVKYEWPRLKKCPIRRRKPCFYR